MYEHMKNPRIIAPILRAIENGLLAKYNEVEKQRKQNFSHHERPKKDAIYSSDYGE